jgi:nucleotide-binding universal stress UspA family protein
MTDVLLAIDDDEERARRTAEAVAALDWDVLEVTVLHVFTGNVEGASVSQLASARAARDVLEGAGIETTLAEDSGDPGQRIIDEAEGRDVDLVAVAGRKRSPAGKAVFGSVSQSVMLNAEVPVLFCPAEPG